MKPFLIISLSIILLTSCNNAQTTDKKTTSKTQIQLDEIKLVSTIDTIISFEKYKLGKIPKNWSQYFTGKNGESPNWKIETDNGNKVLTQLTKDNPNYHFNEIVFNDFIIKNCELTVNMKAISGKMDQGGGFVWRFLDANNYYVVRANPLEDNVVLYKVENGKRTDLPLIGKGRTYGADVEPLGLDWNNLKITILNKRFTIFLNDKQIFQVEDKTFKNAGKVGLWTKADAVTMFKGFKIKSLK